MNRCSPPRRLDHLLAGPQRQVIGVAQDHLGPGRAELIDRRAP